MMPRGHPAGSDTGVRMDHRSGDGPRYNRRYWKRSNTAGEKQCQVLQEPESVYPGRAAD